MSLRTRRAAAAVDEHALRSSLLAGKLMVGHNAASDRAMTLIWSGNGLDRMFAWTMEVPSCMRTQVVQLACPSRCSCSTGVSESRARQ
jgi:hypothetical protein